MTLAPSVAGGRDAVTERLSPNFDARPAGTPIDILVVHYTGMRSADEALDRLVDPAAKVSAHYLIDEDGHIVRLVADTHRAWHAGVASWRGATDVNARSIGIELVNPGHEFGYRQFPATQMTSLIGLAKDLVTRHAIPARNVVAHSDVAPRRKIDPGELFDWAGLAAVGVGLWPQATSPVVLTTEAAQKLLAEIGYETVDLTATITAFQRRFRPARLDGALDAETGGRINAVSTLCHRA